MRLRLTRLFSLVVWQGARLFYGVADGDVGAPRGRLMDRSVHAPDGSSTQEERFGWGRDGELECCEMHIGSIY